MSLNKLAEHKLITEFQSGNRVVVNQLFDAHFKYVHQMAYREHLTFKKFVPLNDLYQQCWIGYMEALHKFDCNKDVKFLTYAHLWMRHYMFDLFAYSLSLHVPKHHLRKLLWNGEQGAEFQRLMQLIQPRSVDDERLQHTMIYDVCVRGNKDFTWETMENDFVSGKLAVLIDGMSEEEKHVLLSKTNGWRINELSEENCIEADVIFRRVKQKVKREFSFA